MDEVSSVRLPGRERIVVAIPHFWSERSATLGARINTAAERAAMLRRMITTLHESFAGTRRVSPGYDAPVGPQRTLEVLVVTTDDGSHLLEHLEPIAPLFTHVPRALEDPMALPFECRAVLAERTGDFDEFACLEDDMVVADPLFFDKLRWFRSHAADDAVLMANRFERRDGLKAYIDPVLSAQETAGFQDLAEADEVVITGPDGAPLVFRQVDNPHASGWFLSDAQMGAWARFPGFAEFRTDFVAPIESGMCPAVGGPFRLYKAVDPRPDFLEVEHATTAYLEQWALTDVSVPALVGRNHELAGRLEDAEARADAAARAAAERDAAYRALLDSPTYRWTKPLRAALRRIAPRRSR